MRADHAGLARSGLAGARSRVPVRTLAVVTGLTGVVAQVLSHVGGGVGDGPYGPTGVVVGQALWNGAQVGLMLLLLCLWRADRRGWVVSLAIATAVCLPFAHYAISPGGWVLSALLLATCGLAWAGRVRDLGVTIVDAPARGTPTLAKFEFLAFTCMLLCSLYNYNASRADWPYWNDIFASVAAVIGFTTGSAAIAEFMYTLGLDGVTMPPYVAKFRFNNLGAVVFLLVWTVLPFLYVLYFAACAKLARESPGTRVQQVLCGCCILHFLFLTDIVDYTFARGIENPWAEWAHWAERMVWRVAILLPIYQKLATGHLRRGNGVAGIVLHYVLAVWAATFLINQVIMSDVGKVVKFVTGVELSYRQLLLANRVYGFNYHKALVVMTLVYGFMVVAMRCKRVSASGVGARALDGAGR